jgi:hypothetical protein
MPSYRNILVDASERIWIQSYIPDERPAQTWTILDRRGIILGQIVTPAGLRLMDASTDYILGVRKGIDEVEQVVLYNIFPSR